MPLMITVFFRRPAILDENGNFYIYDTNSHNLNLIASNISDPVIGSFTNQAEEETIICRYKINENKLYGMIVSGWSDYRTPVFSERTVSCSKPYMANFNAVRTDGATVAEIRYLVGSATENDTYSVWQST